jgi:hypothetical protein
MFRLSHNGHIFPYHRQRFLVSRRPWLRDQSRSRLQQEGIGTVNELNPHLPSELDARGLDLTAIDFTSPWTVQELEACFIVIDSSAAESLLSSTTGNPTMPPSSRAKPKRARSRPTLPSCRSCCGRIDRAAQTRLFGCQFLLNAHVVVRYPPWAAVYRTVPALPR